jgi:hypothetical protein
MYPVQVDISFASRSANTAHSFSATQSATPSTFGAPERKLRKQLKRLI